MRRLRGVIAVIGHERLAIGDAIDPQEPAGGDAILRHQRTG